MTFSKVFLELNRWRIAAFNYRELQSMPRVNVILIVVAITDNDENTQITENRACQV